MAHRDPASVAATYVDDDGEVHLADTACECDLDRPCTFPPCVASRAADEAYYGALFARERRTFDPSLGTFGEQLVDAGRGHLLPRD